MSAPRLITDEQDAAPRSIPQPIEELTDELEMDASPAVPSSTQEVEEATGEVEADELPAPASRDSIQLFAQSPAQLFLHWSHAADPTAALREAFADAAAHYRLAVRLADFTAATEQLFTASPGHAQWLDAEPDHAYRAEVGFHAEGFPFITVLTSPVVHTPRAAVSTAADHAPEFHITHEDFSRLLEHIGYPPEALAQQTTNTRRRAPSTLPSAYCHTSSGQLP